ncbi:histone-lysine N-methyltransferase SETMAR-like [Oratosquilla oratoria]|uniref:histone-lysine N-methyltransferase SETMAR-like n=1 Tax=Oratosquilla oratoria TaxID=337810 RepID=UPI003F76A6C8
MVEHLLAASCGLLIPISQGLNLTDHHTSRLKCVRLPITGSGEHTANAGKGARTLDHLPERQFHDEMKAVYGDDCLSYDSVVRWKRNFQTGHMSLTDEPRTGQPSLTDSVATVKKEEDLILEDRRVAIHVIMHETGLSYGSVWKIVHDELHMFKVSARWVPRLLTPLQRQTRRDLSKQMLTLLEQDEEDFFGRLKAKVQKSAGKVMLSVFWNCHGVIFTDYLANAQIITSTYYCTLLNKLRDALKKKRRGMLTKGVRLLADNAPAHSSQAAVVEARRCGYEILQHPLYSPDLTPKRLFLVPGDVKSTAASAI